MSDNPYAAPSADLAESARADAPVQMRRPALVWLTQILLVFLSVAFCGGFILAVLAKGSQAPIWLTALLLAFSFVEMALPALLFYGLARRRRWAWHGGVIFSLLFTVFFFWSRLRPVAGPFHPIGINSAEQAGADAANVVMSILAVLYPIRMFLSRKVRAFLGVVS